MTDINGKRGVLDSVKRAKWRMNKITETLLGLRYENTKTQLLNHW